MLFKSILVFNTLLYLLLGIFIPTPILEKKEDTYVENKSGLIATLEIPKISLLQDLYDKDDERSNIDERLIFLKGSAAPYQKNGNVIIAGHSGFENIAYFQNLYKLRLGDKIFLTYYNERYEYEITDMYKVEKTGQVEVIRDSNKNGITLITCYGAKSQLVVIGELKK